MRVNKEQVLDQMGDAKVVLLNVLSKGDYKKLHIKPSESHPFAGDPEAFFKEIHGKYGKEKSFILYCDHFGLLESYEATQALTERGLKAVNYSGGLREWQKAGLPLDGTDVHP